VNSGNFMSCVAGINEMCETLSDKRVRVSGIPLWEKSMVPLGKREQTAHQKAISACLRMVCGPVDWLLYDFASIPAKNAE